MRPMTQEEKQRFPAIKKDNAARYCIVADTPPEMMSMLSSGADPEEIHKSMESVSPMEGERILLIDRHRLLVIAEKGNGVAAAAAVYRAQRQKRESRYFF